MTNSIVSSLLFYKTLIHGDAMVVARWRWIRRAMSRRPSGNVLDVGCGGGAFCDGLARLGHRCLGLSWDVPRMERAQSRAKAMGLGDRVTFVVQDARRLNQCTDWKQQFDYVVCTENIEHILDDKKLMTDMAAVLKKGGLLLLTTPNKAYIPIGIGDSKTVLSVVEDGGHVRVGYSPDDLRALCRHSGLEVVEISYCSGYLSQKVTALHRWLGRWFGNIIAWGFILPLRVLPVAFDPLISVLSRWPGCSICLIARRPASPASQ